MTHDDRGIDPSMTRSKPASDDQAPRAALPSRQERRRFQTRTKLLDAARLLTLEQPIAEITINEIAERADVGFGSFYNHFTSKEAILEATTERECRALRDAIDRVVSTRPSAPERLALGVRLFSRHAARDPMWRWFLVNTQYGVAAVRHVMAPSLQRDLGVGRDAGVFAIADLEAMARFIIGGVLAVLAAGVSRGAGKRDLDLPASMVLRLLGVDDAEAERLLGERLPRLSLSSAGEPTRGGSDDDAKER